MRHPNFIVPVALLALLALLAAACGPGTAATNAPSPSIAASPSDVASPSEQPTESETPSAEESSPGESPSGDGEVTVMVAESQYGQILVDADGMVLYGFTPDEETGESTCYDDCAAAWPPLLEDGEVTVGEGLDDSDFSLIDRTDGDVQQVKVAGWPRYYFAGDTAPGDTNGQGLQGIWFVVSPTGELIRE
jgi:predicted lipoprotein with Yx(FWY)xxD motif